MGLLEGCLPVFGLSRTSFVYEELFPPASYGLFSASAAPALTLYHSREDSTLPSILSRTSFITLERIQLSRQFFPDEEECPALAWLRWLASLPMLSGWGPRGYRPIAGD
eukprot:713776-Pyramimonas_sp.AAC.1